jgi:hypothetical protein
VSAIVGVLGSAMAGATSLELGSADAGINVGQDGASGTINVAGATSGVTSLVAGMSLPI